MNRQEFYRPIWESLVLQQRKSRLLALSMGAGEDSPGGGLSFAEGLILLLLSSSESDRNVGEIAHVLRLERSWVSRIISSLEERKLLDSYAPENDKRSKKLKLSKKGYERLSALLTLRDRVVEQTFIDLTRDEKLEFASLLKELADGLNAPHYSGHPIDGELIRISWGHGVVGENFLNSGLSVSRFQIFFELARRGAEYVTGSDISWVFPVDMSTVARTLSFLTEQGWAERKQAAEDGRKQLVRLSSKGKKRWSEISETATRIVEGSLVQMPEERLARLSELFQKVSKEIPGRHRNSAEPGVEVRKIRTEEIAGYFKRESVPDIFAAAEPERASAFGLYQAGSLRGVLQITKGEKKEDLSVCMSASGVNAARILRFLKAGARLSR